MREEREEIGRMGVCCWCVWWDCVVMWLGGTWYDVDRGVEVVVVEGAEDAGVDCWVVVIVVAAP